MTKKKKIYSKRKEPILQVEKEPENTMEFVSSLYKTENIWSKFINGVIFGDEKVNLPNHENLKYLLSKVNNKQLKKDILKVFMNVEDYDPFKDKIPIKELPQNHRNYFIKIQNRIKNEGNIAMTTPKKKKEIQIGTNNYTVCLVPTTKDNINKELFAQGYDVLILNEAGRYIITSNPELKNRPDFSELYERLQKYEPDSWHLHGSKGMVMVKRGKFSRLDIKQLQLELKKCK